MDHDHSAATHIMDCPVCNEPISCHAHDDEEAVKSLMEAGKRHFEDAGHPADQAMSPEEMEKNDQRGYEKG